MIKLKAPAGHSSVGFEGVEYEIRDGHVAVPEQAEAPLRAHGYTKPDAPEAAKPAAKKR
jgi:hypothetical protein